MEIREQTATAEQKETIRKLHNEGAKKIKISAYFIAALVCIGATFVIRLKYFNFIGTYHQLLNDILLAGACSFGILIVLHSSPAPPIRISFNDKVTPLSQKICTFDPQSVASHLQILEFSNYLE